jgi:hypothetical protein
MGSGGRAGALPSFEACLLRTMATGHRCYIWREEGGGAQHIDCNPRLVEPMRAYLAGLDPVELLLQVSSGKSPAASLRSRAGVRTLLGMQSLLGCGLCSGTRREFLGEFRRDSWWARGPTQIITRS